MLAGLQRKYFLICATLIILSSLPHLPVPSNALQPMTPGQGNSTYPTLSSSIAYLNNVLYSSQFAAYRDSTSSASEGYWWYPLEANMRALEAFSLFGLNYDSNSNGLEDFVQRSRLNGTWYLASKIVNSSLVSVAQEPVSFDPLNYSLDNKILRLHGSVPTNPVTNNIVLAPYGGPDVAYFASDGSAYNGTTFVPADDTFHYTVISSSFPESYTILKTFLTSDNVLISWNYTLIVGKPYLLVTASMKNLGSSYISAPRIDISTDFDGLLPYTDVYLSNGTDRPLATTLTVPSGSQTIHSFVMFQGSSGTEIEHGGAVAVVLVNNTALNRMTFSTSSGVPGIFHADYYLNGAFGTIAPGGSRSVIEKIVPMSSYDYTHNALFARLMEGFWMGGYVENSYNNIDLSFPSSYGEAVYGLAKWAASSGNYSALPPAVNSWNYYYQSFSNRNPLPPIDGTYKTSIALRKYDLTFLSAFGSASVLLFQMTGNATYLGVAHSVAGYIEGLQFPDGRIGIGGLSGDLAVDNFLSGYGTVASDSNATQSAVRLSSTLFLSQSPTTGASFLATYTNSSGYSRIDLASGVDDGAALSAPNWRVGDARPFLSISHIWQYARQSTLGTQLIAQPGANETSTTIESTEIIGWKSWTDRMAEEYQGAYILFANPGYTTLTTFLHHISSTMSQGTLANIQFAINATSGQGILAIVHLPSKPVQEVANGIELVPVLSVGSLASVPTGVVWDDPSGALYLKQTALGEVMFTIQSLTPVLTTLTVFSPNVTISSGSLTVLSFSLTWHSSPFIAIDQISFANYTDLWLTVLTPPPLALAQPSNGTLSTLNSTLNVPQTARPGSYIIPVSVSAVDAQGNTVVGRGLFTVRVVPPPTSFSILGAAALGGVAVLAFSVIAVSATSYQKGKGKTKDLRSDPARDNTLS